MKIRQGQATTLIYTISHRGIERLTLYRPSQRERYFPIGPGIEISVEPYETLEWASERGPEASVYTREGRLNSSLNKGGVVDTSI